MDRFLFLGALSWLEPVSSTESETKIFEGQCCFKCIARNDGGQDEEQYVYLSSTQSFDSTQFELSLYLRAHPHEGKAPGKSLVGCFDGHYFKIDHSKIIRLLPQDNSAQNLPFRTCFVFPFCVMMVYQASGQNESTMNLLPVLMKNLSRVDVARCPPSSPWSFLMLEHAPNKGMRATEELVATDADEEGINAIADGTGSRSLAEKAMDRVEMEEAKRDSFDTMVERSMSPAFWDIPSATSDPVFSLAKHVVNSKTSAAEVGEVLASLSKQEDHLQDMIAMALNNIFEGGTRRGQLDEGSLARIGSLFDELETLSAGRSTVELSWQS